MVSPTRRELDAQHDALPDFLWGGLGVKAVAVFEELQEVFKRAHGAVVDLVEATDDHTDAHVHPIPHGGREKLRHVIDLLPKPGLKAPHRQLPLHLRRRSWVAHPDLAPFPDLVLKRRIGEGGKVEELSVPSRPFPFPSVRTKEVLVRLAQ